MWGEFETLIEADLIAERGGAHLRLEPENGAATDQDLVAAGAILTKRFGSLTRYAIRDGGIDLSLIGRHASEALALQATRIGKLGFHSEVVGDLEVIRETQTPGPGTLYIRNEACQEVLVAVAPVLSNIHLKRAEVFIEEYSGLPALSVKLNPEGAEIFAALTSDSIGKKIALLVDGECLIAPMIQSPIKGGVMSISGRHSTAETEELSKLLMSGELPVPLLVVSMTARE